MLSRSAFRPRLRAALAAALALVLAPFAPHATGADGPQPLDRAALAQLQERLVALARTAAPKTVCVLGVIGLGSGAYVDDAGTVVTNAHVAAGARYAVVLANDGQRLLYRRRGIDYEKDLAVLEPAEPLAAPVPYFALLRKRPPEGTFVAALGFPGGPRDADPRPTFTLGRTVAGAGPANVMGVLDYHDAIKSDAPIFSGNSGGPLVDLEGRLVGLNGAVDLTQGTGSCAVPASLIARRLKTLKGGVIRLPGGRVLDPAQNALLKLLEQQLDPIVKNLMDQRKNAGLMPALPEGALRGLEAHGNPEAAAAFLENAVGSPRNRVLLGSFEPLLTAPAPVLELTDGSGTKILATVISAREVVACATALGAADGTLHAAGGRSFRVAARAPGHDLVLARLERGAPLEGATADASEPAVGTLVAVRGPERTLGAGVVSAPGRPISEAGARLLALAGGSGTAERIVQSIGKLARALGVEELVQVIDQLEAAFKLRRGFAAGTSPRGFEEVLSHDAPCGPAALGAPLVDTEGRLVAVHVAVAHYGTSYAVPIATVRAAFAGDQKK